MTRIDTQHWFFDGDDVEAFATMLSASTDIESDGSPWWIEPESNEVERRRLRPDREVPTGYMATFSILGPGKRQPIEPIAFHVLFDRPENGSGLTDEQVVELLDAGGAAAPSGWTVHTDVGAGFRTESLNVRPTSPTEIATFVFGALRSLGAQLPTGRWRVTSQFLG